MEKKGKILLFPLEDVALGIIFDKIVDPKVEFENVAFFLNYDKDFDYECEKKYWAHHLQDAELKISKCCHSIGSCPLTDTFF